MSRKGKVWRGHDDSLHAENPSDGNTLTVGADGSVRYKGKQYTLYRRYAGKKVHVIEEGDLLYFEIEGRRLSKSHTIKK